MATGRKPQAGPISEIDEIEEFEIDDDVDIVDDQASAVLKIDDGLDNQFNPAPTPDPLDPNPPQDVATTTKNYTNDMSLADFQLASEDEVEVHAITVEDVPVRTRTVRTNVDVGPVYYGQQELHLIKGKLYRVPDYIFDYLHQRNLIWSLA